MIPPDAPAVRVAADAGAVTDLAARRVHDLLTEAVTARGAAAVALAGGSTPRRLYQTLAAPPHRDTMPWSRLTLFMGDERCVPADDPDANQRMVRESLLAGLPEQPAFHPMPADRPDLPAAAHAYADLLARLLPAAADGRPCLDLVLLGVGPDGHTASLFPDTPVLAEARAVAEVYVPRLDAWRMSLTLPIINAARHVLFMATGHGKAEVVARIIGEGRDTGLPAALVAPTAGGVEWYLDREAAARLEER